MTPTGRFRVGRRLSPRQAPNAKRGTMFRAIPWDVWVAAALAAAAMLVAIFEPARAIFIVIYVLLCAYIIVQIVRNEPA
jgi:hypothetical protein